VTTNKNKKYADLQIKAKELITTQKLEQLNYLDIPEIKNMYILEKEIIIKYYDTKISEEEESN